MNIIGIDVSQGESHATLITKEAEEIAFKFKHNKSGFQILNSYLNFPLAKVGLYLENSIV